MPLVEVSSFNQSRKLKREESYSQVSIYTSHPPKRVRRQYRSRISNEDDCDHDTRTFGYPTCTSLSKYRRVVHSPEKTPIPTYAWVCWSIGCKIQPSKQRDNFRSQMKKNCTSFRMVMSLVRKWEREWSSLFGSFTRNVVFVCKILGAGRQACYMF